MTSPINLFFNRDSGDQGQRALSLTNTTSDHDGNTKDGNGSESLQGNKGTIISFSIVGCNQRRGLIKFNYSNFSLSNPFCVTLFQEEKQLPRKDPVQEVANGLNWNWRSARRVKECTTTCAMETRDLQLCALSAHVRNLQS